MSTAYAPSASLGWRTRWVAAARIGVVLGAFRVPWRDGWNLAQPDGGWEYLAILVVGLRL